MSRYGNIDKLVTIGYYNAMTKTTWFTVSGLDVTVAHTEDTKRIWDSYERPKSKQARQAVIEFAISEGFVMRKEKTVIDAFAYLSRRFRGAGNSYIIREAMAEDHSVRMSDNSTA